MKDDCLFCKIVRGEVPSLKLYEDEDVLVMLDAYPDTDGHTLVIPKKHYVDIYEVPKEMLQKMIDTGKIMAKDIICPTLKEFIFSSFEGFLNTFFIFPLKYSIYHWMPKPIITIIYKVAGRKNTSTKDKVLTLGGGFV